MSVPHGKTRKIVRNIGGTLLILLGIAGLVLPFLQGFLFIAAGFALLDFEKKEEWLHRAREHPLGKRAQAWWASMRARWRDRRAARRS